MNTSPAVHDQQRILEVASFRLTPNSLEPVGTPTLDEWIEVGRFIHNSSASVHFWIGDWLNYGELQWRETYLKAVEVFGFDVQTLRADKWVALRVPQERRKEGLSFDHYQTIANLEEEEQEEFLSKAVAEKLTTRDFRQLVKKAKADFSSPSQKVYGRPYTSADTSAGQSSQEEQQTDLLKVIGEQKTVLLENLKLCDFSKLSIERRYDLLLELNELAEYITQLQKTYAAK